jgi:hypothetical protein
MWPHPGAAYVTPPLPLLSALRATKGLGADGIRPSVQEEEALRQVTRCGKQNAFAFSFSRIEHAVCFTSVDADSMRRSVLAGD